MTKHRVFISYSRPDADWATAFARSLKEHGVQVWFDRFEVSPGESLPEALEHGLRDSDVVVAVVNQEGLDKPTLYFELGAALSLGKRVIPILPPDFDASKLPYSLRIRQYLVKGSPEDTAQQLVSQYAA